jgi:alanine racemase
MKNKHDYTAWVEIDLKALRHNFRAIKGLTHKSEVEQRIAENIPIRKIKTPQILSVVKADSYGHGMLKVAKELVKMGTDFLGVSELSEGIILRQNGIKKSILVLEASIPSTEKQLVDHDLIATVCTYRTASALNTYAKSVNKKAMVHIKIDTGMGRLGVRQEEAIDFIKKIMRLPYVCVQGVYTHFPLADTDPKFTLKQINYMYQLVQDLDQQGLIVPYIHGANSMGVVGYKTRIFNLVRPGLMLYGLYPAKGCERSLKLRPVMSVKARVIFVKEIEKGRGISYGHTFVTKKAMKTATISIGYNDGYMRAFSNKAHVLISGKRCKVLGRVTMDQLVVDVSSVKNVYPGTEVVIIGKQKNESVSADELAKHADTINYEIVCSLGNRLPRIYRS